MSPSQLARLVDGFPTEQYSYERIYKELLFPVVTGTYYSDPNLEIEINLGNLRGESHLDYDARTKSQDTNVKLLFVPTREIGRVMSKYRNSILRYNPRSFLELQRNTVNREIESSIKNRATNEFALFNNGITIVTDNTEISSNTARRGVGQLVLTNPQLINGGQTAYTLSRIYDACERSSNFDVFRGKEVLVKIFTFVGKKSGMAGAKGRAQLIGAISKASNAQTQVDEFDRRSNDPLQQGLQLEFFQQHGLFYERKRGEFSDGLNEGYISYDLLVNRERLLRVALACEFRVNQARGSIAKFVGEDELAQILKVSLVSKYVYSYMVLGFLEKARKERPRVKGDRYHTRQFGQALRYGQYAVVSICANVAKSLNLNEQQAVEAVLRVWPDFEGSVSRKKSNSQYQGDDGFDFVNYYKGSTLNRDLQEYRFDLG